MDQHTLHLLRPGFVSFAKDIPYPPEGFCRHLPPYPASIYSFSAFGIPAENLNLCSSPCRPRSPKQGTRCPISSEDRPSPLARFGREKLGILLVLTSCSRIVDHHPHFPACSSLQDICRISISAIGEKRRDLRDEEKQLLRGWWKIPQSPFSMSLQMSEEEGPYSIQMHL